MMDIHERCGKITQEQYNKQMRIAQKCFLSSFKFEGTKVDVNKGDEWGVFNIDLHNLYTVTTTQIIRM